MDSKKLEHRPGIPSSFGFGGWRAVTFQRSGFYCTAGASMTDVTNCNMEVSKNWGGGGVGASYFGVLV